MNAYVLQISGVVLRRRQGAARQVRARAVRRDIPGHDIDHKRGN